MAARACRDDRPNLMPVMALRDTIDSARGTGRLAACCRAATSRRQHVDGLPHKLPFRQAHGRHKPPAGQDNQHRSGSYGSVSWWKPSIFELERNRQQGALAGQGAPTRSPFPLGATWNGLGRDESPTARSPWGRSGSILLETFGSGTGAVGPDANDASVNLVTGLRFYEDTVLTAVPEPSALVLGLGGMLVLRVLRKRR